MTRQQAEGRWGELTDREWEIVEHMNFRYRVNIARIESSYRRKIMRLQYEIREMKKEIECDSDKPQPKLKDWNSLPDEERKRILGVMMGNVDN